MALRDGICWVLDQKLAYKQNFLIAGFIIGFVFWIQKLYCIWVVPVKSV